MSKPGETLVVVNSANRDIGSYPEPNDFVLDLKQRYEVQLISLGFIELPYSQHLIERPWSSFFFDVGLTFPPQNSRTLCFRTASNAARPVVCLPAPYTPVIFEGVQGTKAIWRVDPSVGPVCAHGLAAASLSVLPAVVVFDPSESPLQVVSVPTCDTVVTSGIPLDAAKGYRAVLRCTASGTRTFASADHLCQCLNAFFSDATVRLPLRFSFDPVQSVMILNPLAFNEEAFLLDVSQANLLTTLYFQCMRGVVELQPMRSTRFPGSIERTVPPGNYDFNSLRQQLDVLLNPLGQFGTIQSGVIFVAFFDESPLPPYHGVPLALTIFYDPKAIALALSSFFSAAGLPTAVRVDFEQDTFCIFGPKAFRIFWGETRLGAQLGFDGDLVVGTFHRGAARDYQPLPTRVQLPAMHAGESCQHMRTLVMQAFGRLQGGPPIPVSLAADGVELCVPVGAVPSEYLVAVKVENGFIWTVATSTQAGLMPNPPAALPLWTTRLTPLVPLSLVNPLPAPLLGFPIVTTGGSVNLYFPTAPGSMQPRLAEILGFRPGANLWPWQESLAQCATQVVLMAPCHVTLEGPAYVLLDFGLEHMSATVTHRNGNDMQSTRLFGVCAFRGNFFTLERYYKIEQSTSGINVVNSLNVRILNPWGALYEFHGKNWCASLNFIHATPRSIRTECP